jgi:succinate-semialdehyde dehydrogenase/glutarate-semialdehyde dehydrogenase
MHQETVKAIQLAEKTFLEWRSVPAPQRAKLLRQAGDLMLERKELLAKSMTKEMGKTMTEAGREVDYAAGYFSWFAGEAERIYGLTIPPSVPNKELLISYDPVGVCGLITPWNFPLAIPTRKVAAALAAGCTVVAKPASETVETFKLLAQLCLDAGIPAGAVNVVSGSEQEIGKTLLESPIIRKLSFTGSTEVGKYLYQQAGKTLKKLTLELGGLAPLIVFDDAPIDATVKDVINAKIRNNAQSCVAPNRLLVQESIYEAFVEKLTAEVAKLKVGDPFEPETELSTQLHPASVEKSMKQIQEAIHQGATQTYRSSILPSFSVLRDVTPAMLIFKEETFGPVFAVAKFTQFEEAIKIANDTPFGLAAYVFTTNLERTFNAINQLEYGIIGVNDPIPSAPQASFGGMKHSGFGREGGPTGIYEYLVEKYISLKTQL